MLSKKMIRRLTEEATIEGTDTANGYQLARLIEARVLENAAGKATLKSHGRAWVRCDILQDAARAARKAAAAEGGAS